ncbi:hypothetical protein NEAUS04_1015 [Nematocida ausubeli]|uniref:Thioredoxin domain-containing protein n=1 Tax=Nematocida ausubeli (strain ATCC PRA-371 / ERTm2) TaxID=1913371 RepID=H8ZEA4_NEMA1|nr:uncharacterized protein NESG_01732 [Nematocida ausubeli]EHY64869.1 hypothetical protein NERG_01925 [Nematocida ausubeli]KAI5132876.1 hypothetical protein NEAUS06_0422 [Nematocida ausubeli]KAI5135497.1 hypothetical protein NEAUS07_1191 [Nematocida ausubeli]KAI5148279.1 hypothetical protein NEAUS05_1336 [Nematocida ausubeli]KAI5162310.1 hypothetical protein NEAUS04_1015 [Nematocida ausubeli]
MEDDALIKKYVTERRKELLQTHHILREITDEALLCKKVKKDKIVMHFYDKKFKRCQEMNKALESLAPQYSKIEFLCGEAEKFPYITNMLEITHLPYLATFSDGYFTGGIIGYQDIGDDQLDLKLLEGFLQNHSAISGSQDRPIE